MVFVSRSKGGFKLKQQLVSIVKEKSKNCGFDLCPKKYKYLGNPQLLAEIFSMSTGNEKFVSEKKFVTKQNVSKTIDVKRSKCREAGDDPLDSMRITNCIGCNEQLLLRVANPVCTTCRGIV
jgi:hypothetical protein